MSVEEWAVRFAREVSPEETEHAPEEARAWMEGGEAREALFSSRGRTKRFLFGPETVMMIPYIFQGLSVVGSSVSQALASPNIADLFVVVNSSLGISEITLRHRGGHEKRAAETATPHSSPAVAPAASEHVALLRTISDSVVKELQSSGLSLDKSEAAAFHVLRSLMEDPKGGAALVEELMRTPKGHSATVAEKTKPA